MENSDSVKAYAKISPTAKLTAWWRAQSYIPYAKEIAEAAGAGQVAKTLMGKREAALAAPAIEARHKSVNIALKESGLKNVLEIACGLSPRGFEIAADNGVYMGSQEKCRGQVKKGCRYDRKGFSG